MADVSQAQGGSAPRRPFLRPFSGQRSQDHGGGGLKPLGARRPAIATFAPPRDVAAPEPPAAVATATVEPTSAVEATAAVSTELTPALTPATEQPEQPEAVTEMLALPEAPAADQVSHALPAAAADWFGESPASVDQVEATATQATQAAQAAQAAQIESVEAEAEAANDVVNAEAPTVGEAGSLVESAPSLEASGAPDVDWRNLDEGEALGALGADGAVDAVEATEASGAVATIDSVETIETVEAVESIEAIEAIETVDDVDDVEVARSRDIVPVADVSEVLEAAAEVEVAPVIEAIDAFEPFAAVGAAESLSAEAVAAQSPLAEAVEPVTLAAAEVAAFVRPTDVEAVTLSEISLEETTLDTSALDTSARDTSARDTSALDAAPLDADAVLDQVDGGAGDSTIAAELIEERAKRAAPTLLLDAELADFALTPHEVLQLPTPIPGLDSMLRADSLASLGAEAEPTESAVTGRATWASGGRSLAGDAVANLSVADDALETAQPQAPHAAEAAPSSSLSVAAERDTVEPSRAAIESDESPELLAERDAQLRDFVARSTTQQHVLETLEAVARRVRAGEIAPAAPAGSTPEAVLASVLASLLTARS